MKCGGGPAASPRRRGPLLYPEVPVPGHAPGERIYGRPRIVGGDDQDGFLVAARDDGHNALLNADKRISSGAGPAAGESPEAATGGPCSRLASRAERRRGNHWL